MRLPNYTVRLALPSLMATLGVGPEADAARALPYPSNWPVRVAPDCASLPGVYENAPSAVADAGQRLSKVTLSALLQMADLDDGSAAGAPDLVALSIDGQGRVVAAHGPAAPAAGAEWQCATRHRSAVLAAIPVNGGYSPASPLAHLARIGIRAVQPSVFATSAGDLIVALRVTRRERRQETFGYPAVDGYWLWYRRVRGAS